MPRRGTKRVISKTTSVSIDGRSVSDEKLLQAAQEWVKWEKQYPTAKSVSASAVALRAGYTTTPEWFTSIRFRQAVELIKFQQRVSALQARPEIGSLISELISLGLLEAQRRLILDPSEIPATVLYGDILHKWPKMLHDLNADQGPVKTGDVFQTIVYEINTISNPTTREKLRAQLTARLQEAVLSLAPVPEGDVEPVVNENEVVDDGLYDDTVDSGDESVSPALPRVAATSSDSNPLWDDPSVD